MSAYLTDLGRDLTPLVARHHMLTTDQVAAPAFGNITTRHALRIAPTAIDSRVTSTAVAVWLPLTASTGHQVRLANLDDAVPDSWAAWRQEQARQRRATAERERVLHRDDEDDDYHGTGR